jgi:hypothetical protein
VWRLIFTSTLAFAPMSLFGRGRNPDDLQGQARGGRLGRRVEHDARALRVGTARRHDEVGVEADIGDGKSAANAVLLDLEQGVRIVVDQHIICGRSGAVAGDIDTPSARSRRQRR